MTDPAPAEAASESPAPSPSPEAVRPSFGLFRFAIEGRRAPALFVGGWLATLLGVGLLAIGLAASGTLAAGVLLLLGLGLLTLGLVLLGGSQSVERQAAGAPYGGPSPVLLFITTISATYFAATIVGIGLTAVGFRSIQANSAVVDLIVVGLEAAVAFGLIRLMVVGTGALGWRDIGFTGDRRSIGTGLLYGAVFAVPLLFVTVAVAWLLIQVVGQSPSGPLPPTGTVGGALLHLVSGAGIAPLWEETLYRGVALTAWLRARGPWQAILWSSLLFAAAHVLEAGGTDFATAAGAAIVAAGARLPIALALGWVYARTRTIWAPIGLHAVFNAIQIVLGEIGQAAV